ncbi:spondin-1-like isoform X2 [Lineus longissimus]|uniref:spondin-1-like isoform X2 n=1 Tax=Lineus longissimus TaxID=88925 RepID=UPI00315D81B7
MVTMSWQAALVLTVVVCSKFRTVLLNPDCDRKPWPSVTTARRLPGDNGFAIKILGRPAPEKYIPGQVYTITLNGTYPNQRFEAFYLVAVPKDAEDETNTLGTFQHFSNPPLTKFSEECPHIITHTYNLLKPGISVMWTAPPAGSGCVEFRASVFEFNDIWYKDDGALTKLFCEDTGTGETNPAAMIPDCCACGVAKYHMVFQGNWSRHTHPKDYPTKKQLLHWSNIVGASHSKDYMLWQYGNEASQGVKDVCEFGYPRSMENEIKEHGEHVRTVIKTPGIWNNLADSRWARFTVNRTHHLMSMLTMLGPSPDWCVGVSALDLCKADCNWKGDIRIELYPWDAGTDSGLSYMSQNAKTVPQEKIKRILKQNIDNAGSPFYGPDPIKPMATLIIKRLHPKNDNECIQDTALVDDTRLNPAGSDETDMTKKSQLMSGKCDTTDWTDWGPCSVTCGVGMKVRSRSLVMEGVPRSMCSTIELMEKENCLGLENECDYSALCAVSGWSEWSPCSVTCGKGMRQRERYLIRKAEMAQCTDTPVFEREICMNAILDCSQVDADKNFTVICSSPKVVGTCRGSFLRWYWDTNRETCLPFHYGGCRGNDNRFVTQEKCDVMCRNAFRNTNYIDPDGTVNNGGDPVDCMVTPWTEWTGCSKTCGRGFISRSRMVKRPPENGGEVCPKKLEAKKRCRVQKCPVDCELGSWAPWSACTQTCGDDNIQSRLRPVNKKPKRGGRPCPPRLERRYCNTPLCPGQTATMSPEERNRYLAQAPLADNIRYRY